MATCEGISVMGSNISFVDLLIYPTTCFYYFWAVIFLGLFVLITFILYNIEREKFVQPDILSCMGVSSTVLLFLAMIGTLVTSTTGSIPLIQRDIFIYMIAFWIVIVGTWFFKR